MLGHLPRIFSMHTMHMICMENLLADFQPREIDLLAKIPDEDLVVRPLQ